MFVLQRADITFNVTELCQRMSHPTQQRLAMLKRLVRSKNVRDNGSNIQQLKTYRRSDNVCRFRLGRLQGNSKIIKRRRDTARQSFPESILAQAIEHRKKQCTGRAVCSSIGSV